jgi:hypothetical protein
VKDTDSSQQLFFEHSVDVANDQLFFAFTYPYSYSQVQSELQVYDETHVNALDEPTSIFYKRELLTSSIDGRRIDLLTITSVAGRKDYEHEPLLSGLFPDSKHTTDRSPVFVGKEVIFISSRVHPGEVPAQHAFKGILNLLMDPLDLQARELRARYVFKLIPMLNPDGVYRGHFRMDQLGNNLNRYYMENDSLLQPSIFAAKSLIDFYAEEGKLAVYLDFHAHASKRGCFIYGNVLNNLDDQIQNQLYCKLISLNSAHFDYEACLFSKDHMSRIDMCDQAKGLSAEGSGRVATYLKHKLIHSYTIECNYNTSRVGNEIAAPEIDPGGSIVTAASAFTTNPEKYTPSIYHGVGRACVVAILDLRGHNPCSRIPKSKFKTLDRIRSSIMIEVRSKKEFTGKVITRRRHLSSADRRNHASRSASPNSHLNFDDAMWKRVESDDNASSSGPQDSSPSSVAHYGSSSSSSSSSTSKTSSEASSSSSSHSDNGDIIYIPSRDSNPFHKSSRHRSSDHNANMKTITSKVDDSTTTSEPSILNQSLHPSTVPSTAPLQIKSLLVPRPESLQFPRLKSLPVNSSAVTTISSGIASRRRRKQLTSSDDSIGDAGVTVTVVPIYMNAFRPTNTPKLQQSDRMKDKYCPAYQELVKEQQNMHRLLTPTPIPITVTLSNSSSSVVGNLNSIPNISNSNHSSTVSLKDLELVEPPSPVPKNRDLAVQSSSPTKKLDATSIDSSAAAATTTAAAAAATGGSVNAASSNLSVKSSRRIIGKKLLNAGVALLLNNTVVSSTDSHAAYAHAHAAVLPGSPSDSMYSSPTNNNNTTSSKHHSEVITSTGPTHGGTITEHASPPPGVVKNGRTLVC